MENYKWTASREKDNFYYTQGQKIFFRDKCKNSLVISDRTEGEMEGITNHAVIIEGRNKKLIPISETEEIYFEGTKILKEGIFYLKPNSILRRECLPLLSEEIVKRSIRKVYDYPVRRIEEIKNLKGNNRIYSVSLEDGTQYILKHLDKKEELTPMIVEVLKKCSFFPKLILGNNLERGIYIGGIFYTLEEFIQGESLSANDEGYFNLTGQVTALMHNEFEEITKEMKDLCAYPQNRNPFNESNIISMNLDLRTSKNGLNSRLNEEAHLILKKDLSKIVRSLPEQIIHGDLNTSNFIQVGDAIKVIDTEVLDISKRINEFVPLLLFEGNFSQPRYISSSLRSMLNAYNNFSNKKVTDVERNILSTILKLAMIKTYTIYHIRRNCKDSNLEEFVLNNIKLITEDEDAH